MQQDCRLIWVTKCRSVKSHLQKNFSPRFISQHIFNFIVFVNRYINQFSAERAERYLLKNKLFSASHTQIGVRNIRNFKYSHTLTLLWMTWVIYVLICWLTYLCIYLYTGSFKSVAKVCLCPSMCITVITVVRKTYESMKTGHFISVTYCQQVSRNTWIIWWSPTLREFKWALRHVFMSRGKFTFWLLVPFYVCLYSGIVLSGNFLCFLQA